MNHFREGDPPKPLVLMLHGPTGVGKESSFYNFKVGGFPILRKRRSKELYIELFGKYFS